ncbi:MAG: S8 family peptidase [Labilithrix sp.]|nr:S8 family peptidase [Labilithrix sp.]
MAKPDRPLLILEAPRDGAFRAPRNIGGGPRNPKKGRQIERLDPKFETLQQLLTSRRAALQADPGGVAPEQVLVFETNGPARELHEVVARTPGLEWLADDELRDLAPDEDFFVAGKPDKEVSAQLYLVMSNHEALEQLLSVWRTWKSGQRVPTAFRAWQDVFRQLRDIRPWSVQDRLRETRVLDAWRERVALGVETVSVEIELWFRDAQGRQGAVDRLRRYVERARGQWVSTCLIEPIAYHAVLAKLPIAAVEKILDHEEVELLQCEDIRLFRPVGQAGAPIVEEELEAPAEESGVPGEPLDSPVVALLDGLPLENHAHLRGRLIVDDPDGWSETYPASSRGHGTAMASLILHGDLGAGEPASARSVYVRPILRPDSFTGKHEFAPDDVSWVDLIHRAVRRVVEGDGDEPAAAPSVRVFNLSIGDPFQPFLHALSPLAKLLDWLSWRHKVLFVVSAGNHQHGLTLTAGDAVTEDAVLKVLTDKHRNRRLLSPAESVNAVTVGATPEDAAGEWRPLAPTDTLLVTTDGIPNVVSAFGRGYRRAVKPDVLGPGGRVVLTAASTPGQHDVAVRPRLPPGQKVAAPGRPGDLTAFRFSFGTSNAAALTSRLASSVHDTLLELRDEANFEELRKVPIALWIKTLLVHGASWTKEAFEAAARAVRNERNARSLSDELVAILGYGKASPARVVGCSPERATMLTAGSLGADETKVHALPIPASLHTHSVWRRLTITLSWFTPIRPNHRKYRAASLFFEPPSAANVNPLLLLRANADWRAVRRGTVQHEVLEADRGAINLGAAAILEIPVTCLAEAGPLDESIAYAMAVTLEVAPGVNTRVYDEIRERIRPRVPVRPAAR